MRAALRRHMLETRDNGFIPEGSVIEGFEIARNAKAYPLENILLTADTAINRDATNLPRLRHWLGDENECVRYWAALGCVMLRDKAGPAADALAVRLRDPSGSVRVAAAEALCQMGREREALAVLQKCLVQDKNPWIRLQSVNALQNIGSKALPALPAIEKAVSDDSDYVRRAARYTAAAVK